MMAAPEYYIFTGRVGEVVPDHVTHVRIAKALKFVCSYAFQRHPNIQEVICHDGVEKIERFAFELCPSLRRVIMPGVIIVEKGAFSNCIALTYIECGKLKIIGIWGFMDCHSLSSIDLPSIKIVGENAFASCINLTSVNFGKKLELLDYCALYSCRSLDRISLPLKDGMIAHDGIFLGCKKLKHVDLIGGVYETVTALLMGEWKHDMNEEIDSINRILINMPAGDGSYVGESGEKAQEIRRWITSVLHTFAHYKAEHRRYLNEAAATLQSALPNDIVLKNVLAFLELPSDTSFEWEE